MWRRQFILGLGGSIPAGCSRIGWRVGNLAAGAGALYLADYSSRPTRNLGRLPIRCRMTCGRHCAISSATRGRNWRASLLKPAAGPVMDVCHFAARRRGGAGTRASSDAGRAALQVSAFEARPTYKGSTGV